MMPLIVDRNRCAGCGWCITVCPHEAIEWDMKEPYDCIVRIVPEYCTECLECIRWCRYFAIRRAEQKEAH
jgi:ferredoxin